MNTKKYQTKINKQYLDYDFLTNDFHIFSFYLCKTIAGSFVKQGQMVLL